MNGLVAFLICVGLFFAGLEQGRPGVTVKFFTTAALLNAQTGLPANLATTIAEAEAARDALTP